MNTYLFKYYIIKLYTSQMELTVMLLTQKTLLLLLLFSITNMYIDFN